MNDHKSTPIVIIVHRRSSPEHEALMVEAHREADRILAKEGFKILSLDEITFDYPDEVAAENLR